MWATNPGGEPLDLLLTYNASGIRRTMQEDYVNNDWAFWRPEEFVELYVPSAAQLAVTASLHHYECKECGSKSHKDSKCTMCGAPVEAKK